MRAFAAGEPVRLRRPDAVRPWQHVLEPLSGYLMLAARLLGDDGARFARAWNFGPAADDVASVADVAERAATLWGGSARVERGAIQNWHEAGVLRLDSSLAHSELGWTPRWSLEQALGQAVAWHQAWGRGDDMQAVCHEQIAAHGRAKRR
jgi:CDP-glucose 4,6-dehydratase